MRTMQSLSRRSTVALLLLGCTICCSAFRVPLSMSNSTAAPSTPWGPCGKAIPAGVPTPKGPGYCPPGYFCGWEQNTRQPSKCLPVPDKCGTAGNACCPSNTDSPHTSLSDKLNRKPYCKDGSTCFYFAPVPGLDNGDFYAGNKGGPACTAIPSNCGTGQGSPCCPMPYHISANPTLPQGRYGCGQDMFCNYNYITRPAGSPDTALPSGTCEPNSADCGQFGKKCCVFTGGAATGLRCGAQYGQTGPKGYCANPAGYTGTGQAPLKDLICTQCPPSDTLDPSLEKTNPDMFYSCKVYPAPKP